MHIIKNSDGTIKTAGDGDGSDWVLADGELLEIEPGIGFAEYVGRLKISSDKTKIQADGQDEATLTISTNIIPAPASIEVLVNGVSQIVLLTNGIGTLSLLAEVPGTILIEPADQATYMAAGEGSIGIEAIQ
jgi:hypothetical protein